VPNRSTTKLKPSRRKFAAIEEENYTYSVCVVSYLILSACRARHNSELVGNLKRKGTVQFCVEYQFIIAALLIESCWNWQACGLKHRDTISLSCFHFLWNTFPLFCCRCREWPNVFMQHYVSWSKDDSQIINIKLLLPKDFQQYAPYS